MINNYLQNRKIQFFGVLIIFSFFLIRTMIRDNTKNEFKENGSFTIGKIIDHNISGINENFYIKCLYIVDGQKYINITHYRKKYKDCHKTRKCIGLKFKVYYDPKKPKKSFVDYDNEI